jgi:hypothetical protein
MHTAIVLGLQIAGAVGIWTVLMGILTDSFSRDNH